MIALFFLVLLGVGGFVLLRWNAPATPGTSPHAGKQGHSPQAQAQTPQGQQAQAMQIAQAASNKDSAFLAAAARNAARGFDVHVPTANQPMTSPMPRTFTPASLVATYSPSAVAPLTAAYTPPAIPAPPTGYSSASSISANRPVQSAGSSPASQISTAASPLLDTLASQAGLSSGLTQQALGLGAAAAGGASPTALGTALATDVTANAMQAAISYQTGDASTVPPVSDGLD
jgi:hypothetical protein